VPDLWLAGGYLQLSVGKRGKRQVGAAPAAGNFNLVNPKWYSIRDLDLPLSAPEDVNSGYPRGKIVLGVGGGSPCRHSDQRWGRSILARRFRAGVGTTNDGLKLRNSGFNGSENPSHLWGRIILTVAAVAIAYLVQIPPKRQAAGVSLPSFLLGVISTTLVFPLVAQLRALGAGCVALAPLASNAGRLSGKETTISAPVAAFRSMKSGSIAH
jgi:hypothetical protein